MRFLLGMLVVASAAPTQQILQRHHYTHISSTFAPLGDVDGDGYEDLLGNAVIPDGSGPNLTDWELRLYSGRDFRILRTCVTVRWPHPMPRAIFAGDVNGDGHPDYATAEAPWSVCSCQRIHMRNGVDDSILWTLQNPLVMNWQRWILGDIDLNGDGKPDLLVADASGLNQCGTFWAYDHRGRLLYQRSGPNGIHCLGQSVAKLGDVDGDRCDDFVMGLGDPSWFGAVEVVSGRTAQTIRIVRGNAFPDYIGSGVVGCGDLDGDGVPDFAAGGGLTGATSSVQAFSGATGGMLFAFYPGISDGTGSLLYSIDYDQDEVLDIIAPCVGGVRVISGRERGQIAFFSPPETPPGVLEAQPLLTPDGFPRFLTRQSTPLKWLVSTAPHHSSLRGTGCAGLLARPPLIGMRELQGNDRRLTLAGAPPASGALLLLGLADQSRQPLDLAPFGLPGCLLHAHPVQAALFLTGAAGIDAGFIRLDFRFPASPSTFGNGIDAQWAVFDSTGRLAATTAALRFAITPSQ